MKQPARPTLLPGVADSTSPPIVTVDSERIITSARRRAIFRDTFDLMLLAGVDSLFLRWPHAHLPAFDRDHTALVVAAANALVLTYMWSSRALPRWRARRVASTWSAAERRRFVRF